MDVSVFADPVKVGPGIWFKMHTDAIKAITDNLKSAFVVNINAVCDNFKCKKCQSHFRKFIDTYPLENYWNIHDEKGRDIGFFKWTWEMHNQVNKFLKKYEPTLQEAYDFFSNTEIGACFNCGNNQPPREIITSIITSESSVPEQRSRAIPPILTLYRESGDTKPQLFRLIPRHN